jgi:GxxExxY protein
MELDEISYSIRGAIFKVYNELGPGLLESVYEAALSYELVSAGLNVKNQVPFSVVYKEVELGLAFRFDILVEDQVIIEIKSVDVLNKVHKKQVMTYLKLSGLKLGILVNFNADSLIDKESLIRIVN